METVNTDPVKEPVFIHKGQPVLAHTRVRRNGQVARVIMDLDEPAGLLVQLDDEQRAVWRLDPTEPPCELVRAPKQIMLSAQCTVGGADMRFIDLAPFLRTAPAQLLLQLHELGWCVAVTPAPHALPDTEEQADTRLLRHLLFSCEHLPLGVPFKLEIAPVAGENWLSDYRKDVWARLVCTALKVEVTCTPRTDGLGPWAWEQGSDKASAFGTKLEAMLHAAERLPRLRRSQGN